MGLQHIHFGKIYAGFIDIKISFVKILRLSFGIRNECFWVFRTAEKLQIRSMSSKKGFNLFKRRKSKQPEQGEV